VISPPLPYIIIDEIRSTFVVEMFIGYVHLNVLVVSGPYLILTGWPKMCWPQCVHVGTLSQQKFLSA